MHSITLIFIISFKYLILFLNPSSFKDIIFNSFLFAFTSAVTFFNSKRNLSTLLSLSLLLIQANKIS